MKKIKFIAFLAVVLMFFNACQEEGSVLQVDEGMSNLKEVGSTELYSENGYLVFKSVILADSIADQKNQMSIGQQSSWEESLKFTSARTYRYQLNDEILNVEDYYLFEQKVKDAETVGYFDKENSCMTYPFDEETWASILNEDGIVKIGNVLYRFNKTGGVAIFDGNIDHISVLKGGGQLPSSVKYLTLNSSLKSVMLSDYGAYFNERKWDGDYVLDVNLVYSVVKVPKFVYDPEIHDYKWVNMPDGVKYELYCHQRVKKWYGWFDSRTYLYHKDYVVQVGGNYVAEKNFYYPETDYVDSSPSIRISSSEVSNHYIRLYSEQYPFYIEIEDQPAPSTSPVITLIDFDVWTGRVGSETDHIDMVIN